METLKTINFNLSGRAVRFTCISPLARTSALTVRSPRTWRMTSAWGEPMKPWPESCRGKLAHPCLPVTGNSLNCERLKLFEVCRFPSLPT